MYRPHHTAVHFQLFNFNMPKRYFMLLSRSLMMAKPYFVNWICAPSLELNMSTRNQNTLGGIQNRWKHWIASKRTKIHRMCGRDPLSHTGYFCVIKIPEWIIMFFDAAMATKLTGPTVQAVLSFRHLYFCNVFGHVLQCHMDFMTRYALNKIYSKYTTQNI